MCSIFGLIFLGEWKPERVDRLYPLVKGLALAGATRGIDATGLGWADRDGAVKVYKDAVSPYEMVRRSAWRDFVGDVPAKPLLLLGHTRKVTTGANSLENAHPFVFEQEQKFTMGVHNGTIGNDKTLWSEAPQHYEVDSANFFNALTQVNMRMGEVGDFLYRLQGSYAIVAYHQGQVILARNTSSPCVLSYSKYLNAVVFASLDHQLEVASALAGVRLKNIRVLGAGTLVKYNPEKNSWRKMQYEVFGSSGYSARKAVGAKTTFDPKFDHFYSPEHIEAIQKELTCELCGGDTSAASVTNWINGRSIRFCKTCDKLRDAIIATSQPMPLDMECESATYETSKGAKFLVRQWRDKGKVQADLTSICECGALGTASALSLDLFNPPWYCATCRTKGQEKLKLTKCLPAPKEIILDVEDKPEAKSRADFDRFMKDVPALDAGEMALLQQTQMQNPQYERVCGKCNKLMPLVALKQSKYCSNYLCKTCEGSAHAFDFAAKMRENEGMTCERCNMKTSIIKFNRTSDEFLCEGCAVTLGFQERLSV